jgi:peptidoglycan hydrolase CwlO-like protein
MNDLTQYMPVVLAVIGSAGLWGFLSQKAKMAHEKALKDDATVANFNDTLKTQVDRLAEKMDKLQLDKDELLLQMAEMKAQLAEAHVTIKHLEELLRQRNG